MQSEYSEVVLRLYPLLAQKDIVLAIDGMTGAGKSSLAESIAEAFSANIVHCAHFIPPNELMTGERFAKPGANIDYERMKEKVIDKIRGSFSYCPYDPKLKDYGDQLSFTHRRLTIVEGAYSMHPYFGKYYDFAIFAKITPEEQLLRLKAREGQIKIFKERWIPLENQYFKAYDIENKADLVLSL